MAEGFADDFEDACRESWTEEGPSLDAVVVVVDDLPTGLGDGNAFVDAFVDGGR